MITICLDFGNTRMKYAIFKEGKYLSDGSLDTGTAAEINAILEKYKPSRSILSSVINHNAQMEEILEKQTSFHKLTSASALPLTLATSKPSTVGADRLALAAAVISLFPKQNNLVISLGTCITYNFINKYHEFIGGSISPGMDMRFKSLNQFTEKLPYIEFDWNFPLIGYDTKSNIQSGVINGIAKEIDGVIDLYKEKFNKFNVHLTGGDTVFFGSLLKSKIFADPYLIYKGLYAISEYNQNY